MSSGPGPTFCQRPFSQFMAILLSASSSPQPPNVLLGSSDLASPDEDYLYAPHPPAPTHPGQLGKYLSSGASAGVPLLHDWHSLISELTGM